jgi:hypothetical protein
MISAPLSRDFKVFQFKLDIFLFFSTFEAVFIDQNFHCHWTLTISLLINYFCPNHFNFQNVNNQIEIYFQLAPPVEITAKQ